MRGASGAAKARHGHGACKVHPATPAIETASPGYTQRTVRAIALARSAKAAAARPEDTGMAPMPECDHRLMPRVRVYVTLKPSLLDSAGRTVADALEKLGYPEVSGTRIGKLIELDVKTYDEARVKAMCDKLLANPVIEDYRFEEVT